MASKKTFSCPYCGKEVPANAKACPHCGACDKTGWKVDEDENDGVDEPEENFDDGKFIAEEFGEPRKARGKQLLWKITAAVLLLVFMFLTAYDYLFDR